MSFEEVLQGGFPCKSDGTAFEFTLEKFVFDEGFANLPDTDMRVFDLPDLTALERLDGDALFLRRVLHCISLADRKFRREENPNEDNEGTREL